MPFEDDIGPIEDDEILYRRIPISQYDSTDPNPSPEAFRPHKNDTTGISLSRGKHTTIEKAARGHSEDGYYIAILRAGDLRKKGIEVVPKPLHDNPGHSEIPQINYTTRKTDSVKEYKNLLAEKLCLCVKGPLGSSNI